MALVTLGVDTHADTHVAVALDELGRVMGTAEFDTTPGGYRQLVCWGRSFGRLERAGVEGTGAYGAGLARLLSAAGVEVIEVNRPNRSTRRRRGKSDPTDAEAAGRAVLSGEATAVPKARTGIVESIRVVQLARRSAVKAKTQVGNQIKDVVLTAPDDVRELLRPLTTRQRAVRCARWRPDSTPDPGAATRRVLQSLARRWLALHAEAAELHRDLAHLVQLAAPRLLAEHGVGVDVAAKLLIAAGDNPHRLRSEASFAALCGVSPVEASSGKTRRHRLNRGGDRDANNALWTVALVRLSRHPATRDYADRRRKEGLSTPETIRCLKRYLARHFHPLLVADLTDARTLQLT